MDNNEKDLLELKFQVGEILKFVEKVANDSETFTTMKNKIEEVKHKLEHLSDTIQDEVDIYMNKPHNREDLYKVIDDRVITNLNKTIMNIALKVLGVATVIITTVVSGVIMLWIK